MPKMRVTCHVGLQTRSGTVGRAELNHTGDAVETEVSCAGGHVSLSHILCLANNVPRFQGRPVVAGRGQNHCGPACPSLNSMASGTAPTIIAALSLIMLTLAADPP